MFFVDYRRAFEKAARRWKAHYGITVLGRARNVPRASPLLRLSNQRPGRGGLMLMAGFHGEEPAGPLTLLHNLHHILGNALDLGVPLSIYPVVNPFGFDHRVRTTVDGAYTNAGFIHGEDPTGPETALLVADMKRFKPRVFLDLHEDDRETRTYLYAFGNQVLAASMVETLSTFIQNVDGELSHDGALRASRGQIRDHHDGSAEDFMSHEGVLASFASETPARADLRLRMAAKLALVDRCLGFVADQRRGG
jgi:predicted deacylase